MIRGALTLREYEGAQIGPVWDAPAKTVSRREVALIDLHQRQTGKKLFDLGYRSIKATNWVGVIGLGARCIEVIPKIDEPDELKARENLLHMIARAGLVPLSAADITRLANTNKPLLEAYMELYVEHLRKEWRKGQIRRYVLREENRKCLKGKLLLPIHLRMNLLHRERFFTASDEFTCDNDISQILKAALRRCQEQLFSNHVAQRAKSLLPDFEDVSDVQSCAWDMEHIRVDRCINRFEPLLNMAKFILQDVSPSPAESGHAVYSLMFDMNDVFERFIAAEVRSALRGEAVRVRYQVSGRSLLLQNGRRQFALRPDIGVYQGKRNLCLIDTKWKRLDRNRAHDNVSQSDIYQMYAYGKEYDSPRVILLYPRHNAFPNTVADYKHLDGEPPKCIQVRTIDVSEPLARKEVRSRLRETLQRIVFGTSMREEKAQLQNDF